MPKPFNRFIEELSKLPGIGEKTAHYNQKQRKKECKSTQTKGLKQFFLRSGQCPT